MERKPENVGGQQERRILATMDANTGALIHCHQEGSLSAEIRQQDPLRWLHFGDGAFQSIMDITRPELPVLPYIQAMLGVLLLQSEPRSCLNLGLGGGALERFLARYYPQLSLNAVEQQAELVTLARRFFELPDSLLVTIDDAKYLLQSRLSPVDLLFCDLYGSDGHPEFLQSEHFYRNCHRVLAPGGVIVINLLYDEATQLVQCLKAVRCAFAQGLLLNFENYRNTLVFCFDSPVPEQQLLNRRAEQLLAATGLDLRSLPERFVTLPPRR